jgi:Raf kinase inhibitor-like YbhB/YbcL family protein
MKTALAALALAFAAMPAAAMPAVAMTLTSGEMRDGASLALAQVYGKCGGGNISPSLEWRDAPAAAKSFAVTVFDPDAKPDGWWHWIVFDIPANAAALARGGPLPAGTVQGTNDFGEAGYGGACPPAGSGLHHYRFTLWAMDTAKLPFDHSADGTTIGDYLKKHSLAKAVLTPVLER